VPPETGVEEFQWRFWERGLQLKLVISFCFLIDIEHDSQYIGEVIMITLEVDPWV
jgi:hypothetical protein